MAKYTNPSPKPYALPPERARQAARTHQAMDDIELSTGPWLEIGRRYPSEAWPTTPVDRVCWPGLQAEQPHGRSRRRRWPPVPRKALKAFNIYMLVSSIYLGVRIAAGGGPSQHQGQAALWFTAYTGLVALLCWVVWRPRGRNS